MPRKPTRPKRRRETGTPGAIIRYLETGDYDAANDGSGEFFELYWLKSQDIPAVWAKNRRQILRKWIKDHPGTRPWAWWEYEAPTMRPIDAPDRWRGTRYDGTVIEPRRQVGGIGDPAHLHLNYVPWFKFGVPVSWLSQRDADYYSGKTKDIHGNPIGQEYKGCIFPGVGVDPDDPPLMESQAAYLQRHGLLTKSELNQLESADFEPESIKIDA